jgi:peroxiredoxin (alkyl hydroperoxide reductase subunit C)
MLTPGTKAPDFDLPAADGGRIAPLKLREVGAELIVLFFYPRDFSFICPTEVTGFNDVYRDFKAENCAVIGASVDSADSHLRWASELGGIAYPLLADEGGSLARAYGVFDDSEKTALRATFILDPARIIQYSVASPYNVGRSVSETLRVVRAIRTGQMCPAEWMPGMKFGPAGSKF